MADQIRSIAFGGGGQSTAQLVLAVNKRIDFNLGLFANTGEDDEDPYTLSYVRHIAAPYAAFGGFELVEVQKTIGGKPDSILGKIARTNKSEVIPIRSSADGPPMSRSCTWDFKIETMGKELKRRGAGPDNKATVALGISSDEVTRAGRAPRPWENLVYPLLGLNCPLPVGWTRPLRRTDCEHVIRSEPLPKSVAASLKSMDSEYGQELFGPRVWEQLLASSFSTMPVPYKSSCWYCPMSSYARWQELRRDRPNLFAKACELEERLSEKAGAPRYLTRLGVPLVRAIVPGTDPLFDLGDEDLYSCTSGMCAT